MQKPGHRIVFRRCVIKQLCCELRDAFALKMPSLEQALAVGQTINDSAECRKHILAFIRFNDADDVRICEQTAHRFRIHRCSSSRSRFARSKHS